MTLSDDPRPLLQAAGFCIGSALLWLGLNIGASARDSKSARLRWGLTATSLVLLACGWWWPGHFIAQKASTAVSTDALGYLGWPLALALSGLGRSSGALARRRTVAPFLALTLATLALAYLQATLAMPALFHVAAPFGPLVVGGGIAAIAVAAIGPHLEFIKTRRRQLLSAFAAPGAAMLLALLADAPAARSALGSGAWPEALAMTAVIFVAAMLLLSLNEGPRRAAGDTLRRQGDDIQSVDSLTQLPTRIHFERQLALATERCDEKGRRLALLFIDLDGFKPVNDTYGHNVGDMVLEQVGQRLRSMSRGKDVAARIGGDEFLLLLPQAGSDEAVGKIAQRLIEGLSQTYVVEHRDVSISCSVGIAFYPDGCDRDKLIARADAAMYAAKRSGGSTHSFYTPSMETDAQDSFELIRDLRKALANNELELFYQPKIDAKSGKITAAEALLRWNHPTRGQVMPGVFIPLAERSGLITALGNWVIEDACRQGRVWRDKGLRMRVAINLSPHQMRRDDIVTHIAEALERHRIHPSLLTCEITESVAMEDTRATQETFRQLGALGAHLSIDDFGTGYSSLSYLRRLPAEELKIDRSFVMDIEHSADARAVVDAVVRLAHALGLKVVAEGVENQRQQQILVELGCDELQGYLFAKPMSARALLLWAMSDRLSPTAFRPSLFGETKQASRQM